MRIQRKRGERGRDRDRERWERVCHIVLTTQLEFCTDVYRMRIGSNVCMVSEEVARRREVRRKKKGRRERREGTSPDEFIGRSLQLDKIVAEEIGVIQKMFECLMFLNDSKDF